MAVVSQTRHHFGKIDAAEHAFSRVFLLTAVANKMKSFRKVQRGHKKIDSQEIETQVPCCCNKRNFLPVLEN